jgi:hypothetical protein
LKKSLVNVESELLAWIWAYRQTFRWFDEFDATALETLPNEWPSEIVARFLRTYGLTRGSAHVDLATDLPKILKNLHPHFSAPLDKNDILADLKKRWTEGIETSSKYRDDDYKLRSFTSKVLWFYQPQYMTMYDERAREGLRRWKLSVSGRSTYQISETNFLELFEKFFADHRSLIEQAAKFCDRPYPFERRVADQWLWLNGNPDRDAILGRFRSSLKRAPIKPRPEK